LLALIDGDSIAYRAAASCEPTKTKLERERLEFALGRCNDTIHKILYDTNAPLYELYIGGGPNFRHLIDPNYKANRSEMIRPEHLEQVREYMVTKWKAKVVEGIEAEDAVGIAAYSCAEDFIICHIDKDLNQYPGWHYNFVTHETYYVTPLQGWRSFYTQLILGDRVDNIPGFDGKMRPKPPKFLQPYIDQINEAQSTEAMYQIVHSIYELGDEALLRNGQLLYLQKEPDDTWSPPGKASIEVN
jgi:hypothetical protein